MAIRILITVVLSLFVVSLAATAQPQANPGAVRVRYMVKAIEPAVSFYTKYIGFQLKPGSTPNFAMLSRGNLELVLSTPFGPGGAAKPMLDGRRAEPGGLEPDHHKRQRPPLRGRPAAQGGPAFSKRHPHGARRIGDPAGRSLRQPGRALSARPLTGPETETPAPRSDGAGVELNLNPREVAAQFAVVCRAASDISASDKSRGGSPPGFDPAL